MFRSCLFLLLTTTLHAADWPMWRHDAGRTASTKQAMPEKLDLLWSREFPPVRPAFKEPRLQFDRSYEPVVAGKKLILGSSREDCIIAFDTDTGAELWRSYAEGPVRLAPVIVGDLVIFGADDGVVRCVKLADGSAVWSKRAVPSKRQLLGNQRLISVWPVRGGPVAKEGRVYFAAGVWPIEGTFVFCWDAATGEQIWCNDRCSYLYGIHPHQSQAMGGLAPQGYLLVDGEDLIVPCSTAYPARLDLRTGALKEFQLPSDGRLTGGWFASTPDEKEAARLKRRGLLFDDAVSSKRHEDKLRSEGLTGIQRTLHAADHEWSFDHSFPDLRGRAHSVIVADEKCFVVTDDGVLHAYGTAKGEAKHWKREIVIQKADEELAKATIKAAGTDRGYVLMIGPNQPGFIESLLANSHYHIIVLAEDMAAKARLIEAGLYGERASVMNLTEDLPPYFANVIIALEGGHEPFLNTLRPNGGKVIGPEARLIHTRGALEGSTNYLADWNANEDPLVQAPLGVLWFDDALSNFKRAPQPKIVDGVMITADKDWLDATNRKGKLDYKLLAPVFSDIYTGRVLDEYEEPELRKKFGSVDMEAVQQAQYRPPTQKNDWAPDQPKAGLRINPLTSEEEPRVFPKSYGCDGGFDYGGIYTFRSGTAAFYDKKVESGTVHISGPRSGCTNSIVPAGGILNVPYFYEGCTCSYPLPMALALFSLPENFEQWATWGAVPAASITGKIERIGINFGAPGDRKTRDGTLWLDYPNIGGPSPEIQVTTEPAKPEFYYHHSVWIEGGQGWPWVAASGVKGLRSATLSGLKPGTYTVRLTFASPDSARHTFDLTLQDKPSITQLTLPNRMIAMTKTVPAVQVTDGTLTVKLNSVEGETLLSGIELVRDGLKLGNLPEDARVAGRK
ncbi:PQQ-binding-like beta-propeller repeat protein [Brevifollis gellanilyticus]|nr:PQQ-binding-like beta-propeller repeat protein [Brevifollis gellanilyticus]